MCILCKTAHCRKSVYVQWARILAYRYQTSACLLSCLPFALPIQHTPSTLTHFSISAEAVLRRTKEGVLPLEGSIIYIVYLHIALIPGNTVRLKWLSLAYKTCATML